MADPKPHRNTRQRQVLLEELRKLKSHPTATALYEIVRRRLPKISLGTVYRNLELLIQMDQVRKLDLGGAEARFDGDLSAHDHVRCLRCGRVDDVPAVPLALPAQNDPSDHCLRYTILGRHLELIGICPQCRAGEPEQATSLTPTIPEEQSSC